MFKRFQVMLMAAVLSLSGLAASAAEHPAQGMVVNATTAMLDVLRNDEARIKSDPAYLQAKVDELIVPNLDFSTMTKLAVGKFWRKADNNQQLELIQEFKTLLLNTYTGALTEYRNASISFDPYRPEDRDDRAVVRSTFSQPGTDNVPVIYKLREKDGWSIYDIEVNNISLVTSYRSAFTNEIGKGGIAGLLETLKERNSKS